MASRHRPPMDAHNRKLPSRDMMRAFLLGGCTQQEIAAAYGACRQAVSQQFGGDVPGRLASERVDPIRIMRSVRSPGVMSLRDAATAADCGVTAILSVLRELDVHAAVMRLWVWRRRVVGRRAIIRAGAAIPKNKKRKR